MSDAIGKPMSSRNDAGEVNDLFDESRRRWRLRAIDDIEVSPTCFQKVRWAAWSRSAGGRAVSGNAAISALVASCLLYCGREAAVAHREL